METIVVKFGGSSLADSSQYQKVAAIIRENPSRRFVVASAPGKRSSDDIKVTDLLYRCYDLAAAGDDFSEPLALVRERFAEIITSLGVAFPLDAEMETLRAHLAGTPERDYMASRGEYLGSKILAAYLDFPFVDAADLIRFTGDGSLDPEPTYRLLRDRLSSVPFAVIPGFYGADGSGMVHTFSRGGSDVTGALVAKGVGADVYENWTDVSGMLFTDPRIFPEAQTIPYVTYRELRELSYMGASVLHEDAVFPAREAGIPINIRNTNRPADAGTMIVAALPDGHAIKPVTGIAGRKGFTTVQIEKTMMNSEVGFCARLLEMFAAHGVPFEHCPSGIDTISMVVSTELFDEVRESVLRQIRLQLKPDNLVVEDNMAMIAVVGQGMISTKGIAARLFGALAEGDVNIRMIDQGSSELNIIIGVDESDYESAIRSISAAFA